MRASNSPAAEKAHSGRRVRLFDGVGGFLRTVSACQADELVAVGLAEWRGDLLRFVAAQAQFRRGLDGLKVNRRETADNARGCYTYPTRTLLEVTQ